MEEGEKGVVVQRDGENVCAQLLFPYRKGVS